MNPETVHKLAGALIVIFVAVALSKEMGRWRGAWQQYILPVGAMSVGLFLVLDPIVFHGGDFGAEGRQHQLQGGLFLAVGAIELARCRGKLKRRAFGAVLPLAIVVVGMLFIVHTQHGGGDMALQMVQHRILGTTLILTGVVKGLDGLGSAKGNWAAVGWLLLLLAVALQLFLYVEGVNEAHGGSAPKDRAHGAH